MNSLTVSLAKPLLFKFPSLLVVVLFGLVLAIVLVRKIAYELYKYFPNAVRVQNAQLKRKVNFYWRDRADFLPSQLARLYFLFILARLDKYVPLFDCEWQAAKAQYFHDKGRYSGMRARRRRRI